MRLLVGLGNPGKKYELTRHNLGFRVLDMLAGSGKWEVKYDSMLLKTDDVILAKPQTFMNKSGTAIKQILKFYPDAEMIVVHDDIDLPLGSLRVQKNISSAGHNGVQNIIDELGTQDFIRLRLGINNPDSRFKIQDSETYVLQKFTKDEETLVQAMLSKALEAIDILQTDGLEVAQSRFNG